MNNTEDARNDTITTKSPGSIGASETSTRKLRRNTTKERSRMSLSVDNELRTLLEEAGRQCGERTASKTIRWALKKAMEPVPSVTLGFKIIQWAEALPFKSPADDRELRRLVAEMYRELK